MTVALKGHWHLIDYYLSPVLSLPVKKMTHELTLVQTMAGTYKLLTYISKAATSSHPQPGKGSKKGREGGRKETGILIIIDQIASMRR